MLLDILGIIDDFSRPYVVCEEIANSISMQRDLPQHYAVYSCPACFNANYVDVDASPHHNVVACWQCQYEGFAPGVTDEDCHHVGCDCSHCQENYVVGIKQLPTTEECGCSTCLPVEPELQAPGMVCPYCVSYRVDVEDGQFKCMSCGSKGHIEVRMEVTKWPEPPRPIDMAELAKFKIKDFNTDEILVPTFDPAKSGESIPGIRAKRFLLVDEASKAVKEAIQKEEDQNIFATLKQVTDDLDDIRNQIEIVSNDPDVTIITQSYWDNSFFNDAGDYFDAPNN